MPLLVSPAGMQTHENLAVWPGAGVTVTASAVAHTKGATWTQLVASTTRDSYGIFVRVGDTFTSATITDVLVDIGIGAALSEIVLIPDLIAGWSTTLDGQSSAGFYYFPLFIPAGSRLSARSQALITSDTVRVGVHLLSRPILPGQWFGNRVTAYGVSAAASKGTDVACGNGVYGSSVQLTASTGNRIRYMQLGMGGGGDTTLNNDFLSLNILAGGNRVAEDLHGATRTDEQTVFWSMNWLLSMLNFDIAAGIALAIEGRTEAATVTVDVAVYAVD